MRDATPSGTALGVAKMRAIHQILDDEPKVLYDPVAVALMGPSFRAEVCPQLDDLLSPRARKRRSIFIMRSRFAEDRLAEAVQRGITQYVILGAGLDTFAYRQPAWFGNARIFEVDHPATQTWKQELLDARRIPLPANLCFAAIDFEKTLLVDGLRAAGFDPGLPTFVSCLGVIQYLTAEAVDALFQFARSLPVASEIVTSFVLPETALEEEEREAVRATMRRVAAQGEPWQSLFAPEELRGKLAGMGFSSVFHLTPEMARERYFRGRRDGLTLPGFAQMMAATV